MIHLRNDLGYTRATRGYIYKPVIDKINIKDAYESAAALRRDIDGVLFCTGSLYLVGEIMSIIK